MRRLMEDRTLRMNMGSKARAFCAKRYSRDAVLDMWENLLESVSKEKR